MAVVVSAGFKLIHEQESRIEQRKEKRDAEAAK